jgi:ABC-type bacteriocin/lantibiotic exporter with double-glycine peptidase domain
MCVYSAWLTLIVVISLPVYEAIMMLQGVAAPVLRLAQLWPEFHQTGISMQRLEDILNTRTELPQSRQALPPIRGDVSFEDIRFRYRPDGAGHVCRRPGHGAVV